MTAVLDIARLHLAGGRLALRALLSVAGFVALGVLITGIGTGAPGDLDPWFPTVFVVAFYSLTGGLLGSTRWLLTFTVAMGRTRTAFHLGTLLVALLTSLVLGALLHLALVVERSTGGWGAGLEFLGADWARAGDPLTQYLLFTMPSLTFFAGSILAEEMAERWEGVRSLVVLLVAGIAVIAVGAALGMRPLDAWSGDAWFGDAWFAAFLSPQVVVFWLVAAIAGWWVVRRTPL